MLLQTWFDRVAELHQKRWKHEPNLTDAILDKLTEETNELVEAVQTGQDQNQLFHELGDVLFVVAALARHLQLDADDLAIAMEAVYWRNAAKWSD